MKERVIDVVIEVEDGKMPTELQQAIDAGDVAGMIKKGLMNDFRVMLVITDQLHNQIDGPGGTA